MVMGVVLRLQTLFQASTAALSDEGIPQLDKTLGRTDFFFCGFLEMCGVCGMVVGVVLRAADIFSSIHSRSE